jgi:hypothetical protein
LDGGHKLLEGLCRFEPYFAKFRCPRQLNKMEGVGPHELYVLNRMVEVLRPFTFSTNESAKST